MSGAGRPRGERFRGQVFLPKDSYRARRAVDAVRLWPVLGMICFVLPIIWTGSGKSNVGAMAYLFAVWALLIIGGAVLTRRLAREPDIEPSGDPAPEPPEVP